MGRILKKRSVMILLALMLIMGLAPMTASAAPAESVTVGGVTMDSGNQYAVLLQPMENMALNNNGVSDGIRAAGSVTVNSGDVSRRRR